MQQLHCKSHLENHELGETTLPNISVSAVPLNRYRFVKTNKRQWRWEFVRFVDAQGEHRYASLAGARDGFHCKGSIEANRSVQELNANTKAKSKRINEKFECIAS